MIDGSDLSVIYKSKMDVKLLDLFKDWRALIKQRASAPPGSQERARLDEIFFKVLPVIIRITQEPNDLDIGLANEIFDEISSKKAQDGRK